MSKTITSLISELVEIRERYGDLPVAVEDEQIGWPTSMGARVVKTKGYNENGYFEFEDGDQDICVIRWHN